MNELTELTGDLLKELGNIEAFGPSSSTLPWTETVGAVQKFVSSEVPKALQDPSTANGEENDSAEDQIS